MAYQEKQHEVDAVMKSLADSVTHLQLKQGELEKLQESSSTKSVEIAALRAMEASKAGQESALEELKEEAKRVRQRANDDLAAQKAETKVLEKKNEVLEARSQMLLGAMAMSDNIDEGLEDGDWSKTRLPPLHRACYLGDLEAITGLVLLGFRLTTTNTIKGCGVGSFYVFSPVDITALFGSIDTMKWIQATFKVGCDTNRLSLLLAEIGRLDMFKFLESQRLIYADDTELLERSAKIGCAPSLSTS